MIKPVLALCAIVSTLVLAAASPATANFVTVDITRFPNGTVVPDNAIITDQYRDIGILFGARRQAGGPLSLFIGNTPSGRRFLFNTPDVLGAVQQFQFVEPGTTIAAGATFFSTSPDFDFFESESVRLVGISSTGEILKSVLVTSSPGNTSPVISITADPGTSFALVEVRTFGNPGIGFLFNNPDALKFSLAVPEPSSLALLGMSGIAGAAWSLRRGRRKTGAGRAS